MLASDAVNSIADQEIARLKQIIKNLEHALDDQIHWLKSMTQDIATLAGRSGEMNEFIIESLRGGIQSPSFAVIIQNCPSAFLKNLEMDISKYVQSESSVFDIIMNAGYNPEQLCDLDRSVQNVFTYNVCMPYMPKWELMMNRIHKLARNENVINVDWNAAVRIWDSSRSHLNEYIITSPDAARWAEESRSLRADMITAAARIPNVD